MLFIPSLSLFPHQDVTAMDTQIHVILTVLSSRQRAASAAVCATTAATTGWGLSVNAVCLSCTKTHRGGRMTRRPAYVCFTVASSLYYSKDFDGALFVYE